MDLWQVIRTVARRWYILAPVLLVSLGATYAVVSSIDPTYEATAILTLLPPDRPSGEDASDSRNPYLTPGDGYEALTKLLVAASQGNDVRVRLDEQHGFDRTIKFEVSREDGSAILTIVVSAPSATQALDGAVAVREVLDEVLEDQQLAARVPSTWLVTSQTVSEARVAIEMAGSRVRVAIALGVVSVLVALGCAYLVDGFVASRGTSGTDDPQKEDEGDLDEPGGAQLGTKPTDESVDRPHLFDRGGDSGEALGQGDGGQRRRARTNR